METNLQELYKKGKEMEEGVKQGRIKPIETIINKNNPSFTLDELGQYLEKFRNNYSFQMISWVIDISSIFCRMNWVFIYNNSEKVFVGSDYPYCMIAPEREKKYGPVSFMSRVGFTHDDLEVSLPLSSNIALYASWYKTNPPIFEATTKTVNNINARTIRSAEKLFANNKEILEEIDKKS